jgi:hypothetical protein
MYDTKNPHINLLPIISPDTNMFYGFYKEPISHLCPRSIESLYATESWDTIIHEASYTVHNYISNTCDSDVFSEMIINFLRNTKVYAPELYRDVSLAFIKLIDRTMRIRLRNIKPSVITADKYKKVLYEDLYRFIIYHPQKNILRKYITLEFITRTALIMRDCPELQESDIIALTGGLKEIADICVRMTI